MRLGPKERYLSRATPLEQTEVKGEGLAPSPKLAGSEDRTSEDSSIEEYPCGPVLAAQRLGGVYGSGKAAGAYGQASYTLLCEPSSRERPLSADPLNQVTHIGFRQPTRQQLCFQLRGRYSPQSEFQCVSTCKRVALVLARAVPRLNEDEPIGTLLGRFGESALSTCRSQLQVLSYRLAGRTA